ncbi:MAG: HPF/RaiA family ribosome-associated protein [Spirochaetia bacterium]|nr:HPF/RaiA family ribosome-associated protein [Spirochaetia bacterium]
MNFELKGIHYEISEKTKVQFEKKIARLQAAEDNVSELSVSIERQNDLYILKANMIFRWGNPCFIQAEDHELFNAIDRLQEKIKTKLVREKEKIQDK